MKFWYNLLDWDDINLNLLSGDLPDDAKEFDLASYITEEDCKGLSLPFYTTSSSAPNQVNPITPGNLVPNCGPTSEYSPVAASKLAKGMMHKLTTKTM